MLRPDDPNNRYGPLDRGPLNWELRTYVRRLARSLARMDSHLAEDLEQDAYLSALQETPNDRSATRAWMRAVVRHRFLNLRNRRYSIPKMERVCDDQLVHGDDDPLRVLEQQEREDAVRRSLDELPAIYSFAVRRRFLDGALPGDIASELNVSLETVRTRLRRGLHRLRRSAGAEKDDAEKDDAHAQVAVTAETEVDEQTPPPDATSSP